MGRGHALSAGSGETLFSASLSFGGARNPWHSPLPSASVITKLRSASFPGHQPPWVRARLLQREAAHRDNSCWVLSPGEMRRGAGPAQVAPPSRCLRAPLCASRVAFRFVLRFPVPSTRAQAPACALGSWVNWPAHRPTFLSRYPEQLVRPRGWRPDCSPYPGSSLQCSFPSTKADFSESCV